MKETVAALTRLLELQGQQIVELSKALAIAHEHHGLNAPAPVMPEANALPGRLWLTEDEEDKMYAASGEIPQETESALSEILAAAGLPPTPITTA